MNAQQAAAGAVGPWLLGPVLGRGRRCMVHLGRDPASGRAAAVKVAARTDFAHEYRLLQAHAHPALIRAWAHGRCKDDRGWLAMEVAPGGDLSTRTGPVPPAAAARWLREACAPLARLHGQGWVHRDVKPANLLVREDGSLALADLGEACRSGTVDTARAGRLVGSPAYASPEQLSGGPAAPSADVYSLGVVLHQWLTGSLPFSGETLAELHAQHLLAPVPRLPAAVAAWQPLLDAMLAKKHADRLAVAGAVISRIPS